MAVESLHMPRLKEEGGVFLAGKDRIEELLALGASRWEATHAARRRCIRMALMPTLNQMNVVGIVAIPGIMTGQILAGSDPSQVLHSAVSTIFCLLAMFSDTSLLQIRSVSKLHVRVGACMPLPLHKHAGFNFRAQKQNLAQAPWQHQAHLSALHRKSG